MFYFSAQPYSDSAWQTMRVNGGTGGVLRWNPGWTSPPQLFLKGWDPSGTTTFAVDDVAYAPSPPAAGMLVLTLADGSQRTLTFAPRQRNSWRSDCFTMASHFDNEVADLSPAPLEVGSLTFASPVAYPKCSDGRMILSEEPDEAPPLVVLDRDP